MLATLLAVPVFALPFFAVAICFSAKRIGDDRASYYLALTAIAWAGFASCGFAVVGR